MGDTGFAYVPASCAANEPCRVHVALHGCKQSFSDIATISSNIQATTNGRTTSGLSYGDAGLKPATSYRYEVRASSAAGGAGPFSPAITESTVEKVPACDDPGTCAVR